MFNLIKKSSLFFIFALIVLVRQSAYANFEVVTAKTVAPPADTKTIKEEIKKERQKQDEVAPDRVEDIGDLDFNEDGTLSSYITKKVQAFKNRKKTKQPKQKKKKADFEQEEILESEDVIEETTGFKPYQEQEPVKDEHKFKINADRITYDDTKGNIYAEGHVELIAPAQDVTLKADKAVYEKDNQLIKLNDNVKVLKAGIEMEGESLLVDLNEQNILMDNPQGQAYSFDIKAQEGYLIANEIEMINGTLKSNRQQEMLFYSTGFMALDETVANYLDQKVYRKPTGTYKDPLKQRYRIDSKEIVITSYKDHNSIVFKSSDVFINNHRISKNSDLEIISDKKTQVVETNTPEFGSLKEFGTYLGYGIVRKLPKGHTLKLVPAITHGGGDFGVGLIARWRARNGMIEGGWSTSTENAVVRGRYKFGNGFELRYGRHAYIPEGFMGARRSGYGAQMEWKKSYEVEDLDIRFSQAAYAGVFSEYKRHHQEKHAYTTSRFRYLADASKTLFSYKNAEQDMHIYANAVVQGGATVYGSGQTAGIIRIAPLIAAKVRRWETSVAYFTSGYYGETPFMFDEYRYGKSTLSLGERIRLSEAFTVGARVNISPFKDNYDGDLITEARLYAIVGPRDLKLAVSYDFVRDIAHVDFLFLLGPENTRVDFDKLITEDMKGKMDKRDFYRNSKMVELPENI